MYQSSLYAFLLQILLHLPVIIVYIIGIALSVINYKRNPKISVIAGTAFAALLILAFASSFLPVLPLFLQSQTYNVQSIGYIFAVIGFVTTLISAIASGLLVYAVWKDRS